MSVSYRMVGELYKMDNEEQVISDTFKKRSFVLKVSENNGYTEFVQFELIQEKCSLIENFSIGNVITVDFNIKGREYRKEGFQDKYFITLQPWRISAQNANYVKEEHAGSSLAPGNSEENISEINEEDDLPF